MKKSERTKRNPSGVKTWNPNYEPWLTLKELYAESAAIARSYIRVIDSKTKERNWMV